VKVSELIEQLKLVPDQEIPEGVLFMDWVRDNSPPPVPEYQGTCFIRSIEELLHERSYSGLKYPEIIYVGMLVMKGMRDELGIDQDIDKLNLFDGTIKIIVDPWIQRDFILIPN